MKPKDLTKIARGLVALTILVTVALVMRPAPSQAFFPLDLVGSVVNAVAGETVGEEKAPTAEALEAKEHRTSFAEAVLGADRDAGAKTVAQAVRERPLLERAFTR